MNRRTSYRFKHPACGSTTTLLGRLALLVLPSVARQMNLPIGVPIARREQSAKEPSKIVHTERKDEKAKEKKE
jgi:hypothetical protein